MGNRFHKELQADPRTGMTSKEKTAVRATWHKFREHHSENSSKIFVELFTQYPEYKKIFKDFTHETADALAKSPKLQAHGLSVVYQTTAFVESLDDADMLVTLIQKNGTAHTRRKGVTPKHFLHFTRVYKGVIQSAVGSKMTPDADSGWDKLFDIVVKSTSEAFVKAGVCKEDDVFAVRSGSVSPRPRKAK